MTSGLVSKVIYSDSLVFIVAPAAPLRGARVGFDHRARGWETFIAHNVVSPYREVVAARVPAAQGSAQHGTSRCHGRDHPEAGPQGNQGVAFMPRMCVGPELERERWRAVKVEELNGGAEDPAGVSGPPRP